MAKTNRRPSDKFERKQRLAQRPQRQIEDTFVGKPWLLAANDDYMDTDGLEVEALLESETA